MVSFLFCALAMLAISSTTFASSSSLSFSRRHHARHARLKARSNVTAPTRTLEARATPSPTPSPSWKLEVNGTTGVSAMMIQVVSPTIVLMIDRVENNPLWLDGVPAWGATFNLVTKKYKAVKLRSNAFCAGGTFLSNGTFINVGGDVPANGEQNGLQGMRMWHPCRDQDAAGCTMYDDPSAIHLRESRWYPSVLRYSDGRAMIVGGTSVGGFRNDAPGADIPNYEFFPSRGDGNPVFLDFLSRNLPVNLFPITLLLPDGTIFMAAARQAIIWNVDTQKETRLPDIPKDVRVTYPMSGCGILLPLSPPNYTPEVLICGGSSVKGDAPFYEISTQDPASQFCFRLVLTKDGIKAGWRTETMPERRVMPDLVHMPNGQIVMLNGAQSGVAGYGDLVDHVGWSNADNPAFRPVLYLPNEPSGKRFNTSVMPTSNIPRLYHSVATLTPQGNIMIAGSNPNNDVTTQKYQTEYRVEWLNPPYMSKERPVINNNTYTGSWFTTSPYGAGTKLLFNKQVAFSVTVPSSMKSSTNIQVALMDLGFATHAVHNTNRLVFLTYTMSSDRKKLTVTGPPNGHIYPPGPAFLYLVINGIPSEGKMVVVGTGGSPPQAIFPK